MSRPTRDEDTLDGGRQHPVRLMPPGVQPQSGGLNNEPPIYSSPRGDSAADYAATRSDSLTPAPGTSGRPTVTTQDTDSRDEPRPREPTPLPESSPIGPTRPEPLIQNDAVSTSSVSTVSPIILDPGSADQTQESNASYQTALERAERYRIPQLRGANVSAMPDAIERRFNGLALEGSSRRDHHDGAHNSPQRGVTPQTSLFSNDRLAPRGGMYDGAIDPDASPLENLRRIREIQAAGGSARADGQIDGSAVSPPRGTGGIATVNEQLDDPSPPPRPRGRSDTLSSSDRHSSGGEMRENVTTRGMGDDRAWMNGTATNDDGNGEPAVNGSPDGAAAPQHGPETNGENNDLGSEIDSSDEDLFEGGGTR
ncbi:hypothetical protein DOTSEDRAFT_26550 [Dothistroma septosporum NZE10]|uniref:Uncharacterized protein n=1 Tax=Dothistroma septosporum (strain NZE10 / CBS 128990) TaxID=675120 RepID=N1PGW7_DOTSN|nr:hypothetical protein DOTSEDRAFT_26550 [Dothistroma septosporum NZE10]